MYKGGGKGELILPRYQVRSKYGLSLSIKMPIRWDFVDANIYSGCWNKEFQIFRCKYLFKRSHLCVSKTWFKNLFILWYKTFADQSTWCLFTSPFYIENLLKSEVIAERNRWSHLSCSLDHDHLHKIAVYCPF